MTVARDGVIESDSKCGFRHGSAQKSKTADAARPLRRKYNIIYLHVNIYIYMYVYIFMCVYIHTQISVRAVTFFTRPCLRFIGGAIQKDSTVVRPAKKRIKGCVQCIM